jgi:hypothetical protein
MLECATRAARYCMPRSRGENVAKRLLLIVAVIALILAIVMRTSLLAVSEDISDFMSGAAAGLWIGVLVNWAIDRP